MFLGLLPDLVALALIAPVLTYVCFLATPHEVRLPLRFGVGGSMLFVLGCISIESQLLGGTKWLGLALVYGGHMLGLPAWGLVALGVARIHHQRVFPAVEWVLRRAPWVFGLFYGVALTNPLHEQFLIQADGIGRSDFQWIWYAFAAFSYFVGVITIGLYGRMAWHPKSQQARQLSMVMAAATLLPLVANLVYLLFPIPGEHELTSAGFALSSLVVLAAWYQGPLLSLSSVAFSGLFEHDPNAVILTDVHGRIHYSNPSARRLFNAPVIQAGKSLAASLGGELRIPESRMALGIAEMNDLVVEGSRSEIHVEHLPSQRILKLDRFEIPGPRGETHSIAVRFRDETELFDARKNLTEKTSTLEAVLRSSRDGFFITGVQGELRYFNTRMIQLAPTMTANPSAFSEKTVWQSSLALLKDPRLGEEFMERLLDRPWQDHSIRAELVDGRTLDAMSTPLLREGQVRGRVWQVRDLTDERRSDEALRNAQKLESLGVMAGGIAHDFNNLLVGVLGNAEIARYSLDKTDSAREPLAAVVLAAQQASDLTRQLLAYAGREDNVSFAPLDVCEIVHDARELLAVVTPKSVRLTVRTPPGPVTTVGDASQLRQVLMNLVTNAAEAIEGRPGNVSIEVLGFEDFDGPKNQDPTAGAKGQGVRIRVTDDGCGMDNQTQAKIFDPFFTTKFEGRGLGLAATLGIVRGHGGSLHVDTQRGVGSTFEVRLPSHQAEGTKAIAQSAEIPDFGDRHVLLVDDEDSVRRVAARMLRRLGLRVTECKDGADALRTLAQAPLDRFHAVLLDLTMPLISGIEVADRITELQLPLPVIFSSGHPPSAESDQPQVAAFLRKPYGLAQLAEVLRKALQAPS